MPKTTPTIITLAFAKETKNTAVFEETAPKGEQLIQKVYLQKAEAERLGSPKQIKVTIEPA